MCREERVVNLPPRLPADQAGSSEQMLSMTPTHSYSNILHPSYTLLFHYDLLRLSPFMADQAGEQILSMTPTHYVSPLPPPLLADQAGEQVLSMTPTNSDSTSIRVHLVHVLRKRRILKRRLNIAKGTRSKCIFSR